ncbi:HK97-gp10 family putative phage morphogenesis protein [Catenovulum sediminis]|uniref:HK97-gp10 family putative phage morphogenesis protein n=1 Tax=Catenovulum sediminis TaxID=1740262 RepID=A0ABV1RK97_9ALTE|nr:HK97-gp10 family putative phage morphogenesis protein [Catenovulum sediminis]
MTNSISLQINGLKQLNKNLENIADEIGSSKAAGILTSALRVGAKEFETELKNTAPESPENKIRIVKKRDKSTVEIKPGFLKSRIKIRASTNRKGRINKRFGKKDISLVRVGVFKVPYIVQVEYGTSKHQPQPFMRNAAKSKAQPAVKRIESELNKKIKAATKRIAKQKAKK